MNGTTKCYSLQNPSVSCNSFPCMSKVGEMVPKGREVGGMVQLKIPEVSLLQTLSQIIKTDI